MPYDDPAVRAAYRKGANDCYSSSIPHVDARSERAIIEWLSELEAWLEGPPPPPPFAWPSV